MKSNYQKLTMITCLLAGALSFAAVAQESAEKAPDSIDSEQPLSPETEMEIMRGHEPGEPHSDAPDGSGQDD